MSAYPPGAEPLADPLADAADVTPTDPDTTEGKETDIPADDQPQADAHPASWPEGGED